MQTHIVKKMPSLSVAYVDLFYISSSTFNYPQYWDLDYKELKGGKTPAEKEVIWKRKIYKASIKVVARIALFLKNLQHNKNICLPYHFR
jgi:hypothetical protein